MDALPIVVLDRKQRHRALRGHCWIFRNEIERVDGDVAPGDLVEVRDPRGGLVGIGYHNAASQITVRLLSRAREPIDAAFWRGRLRAAIAYRDRALPGRPARRLVNSEGDLLPGLIVDQYGDHLVVQATSLGIDRQLPLLVDLLVEELRPRVVIERSDLAVRKLEGLEPRKGVLRGESDGAITCRIGDATFACNLLDPHKTGFYLDQQASYGEVARHLRPGARVLDTFCHLGGFAIHAALAGAGRVLAVDAAAESIAGARAAAQLSGVGERIEWQCADAFDVLKREQAAGAQYDAIVLDPPSFTRSRATVEGALRGYKEIHLRALRMLPPGGMLATFSCSHHVPAALFLETIAEAAADARVALRLESTLGASPDHPVLPAVPETAYLKGFVLSVL